MPSSTKIFEQETAKTIWKRKGKEEDREFLWVEALRIKKVRSQFQDPQSSQPQKNKIREGTALTRQLKSVNDKLQSEHQID